MPSFLELVLADLATCESNLSKIEKQAKIKKELQETVHLLQRVKEHLDKGLPVRAMELTHEESVVLSTYRFLTAKKVLYLCNIAEEDLGKENVPLVEQVKAYAAKEGSEVLAVCASVESEIAQLPKEDRPAFLATLGLKESGLTRFIKASFHMLGLIAFLTTGEMETRAWTVVRGATAVDAAGKIHTDIQTGFVRAEVIAYEDFVAFGGRVGAKEAGKARAEGKDYIVKDGDVILFLHSH
jgi:hypothetical protein